VDLSGLLAQQVQTGQLVNLVLKVLRETVEIWDKLVRLVNLEDLELLEQLVARASQERQGQLDFKVTLEQQDSRDWQGHWVPPARQVTLVLLEQLEQLGLLG